MIVFVSGHRTLTLEEFDRHYKPRLDEACKDITTTFVVGDCYGADFLAQKYLLQHGRHFVVYHKGTKPRCNSGGTLKGGFCSQTAKDQAMTEDSDVDIAWVRPGEEAGGTAKNLLRRKRLREPYLELL